MNYFRWNYWADFKPEREDGKDTDVVVISPAGEMNKMKWAGVLYYPDNGIRIYYDPILWVYKWQWDEFKATL